MPRGRRLVHEFRTASMQGVVYGPKFRVQGKVIKPHGKKVSSRSFSGTGAGKTGQSTNVALKPIILQQSCIF